MTDKEINIVAINIKLNNKDHTIHCFNLDIKNEQGMSWKISKYLKIRKGNSIVYHPLCQDTVNAPDGWYKNELKVKIDGATYNGMTPVDLSKPLMYKDLLKENTNG